jgi:hypothetical protein
MATHRKSIDDTVDVSPRSDPPLPPWPSSSSALSTHDPIHQLHPEEVALPESRPPSRNAAVTNSDSSSQNSPNLTEIKRMGCYMEYVKKLAAAQFPQLHVLSATPEHESALNVEVIDFFHENQGMRRKTFTASTAPQKQWGPWMSTTEMELLEYLQKERETDVAYRLILVEDLSPGIIEILGATLEADPEFFAEHLIDSGYHERYTPEPSREWNTRGCKKQYFSMQWQRPVRLTTEQWEHAKNPKFGVQIFRPYEELFDVSIAEKKLAERYTQKKLVCWSERISSWSSQDGKSCISMWVVILWKLRECV